MLLTCTPPHGLLLFLVIVSFIASFGASQGHPRRRKVQQASLPHTYAPISVQCPPGPLVRPATGLSDGERDYVEKRRRNATQALAAWLQSADKGFSGKNLPAMALVSSGGGYRSLLLGGGLIQALDARESTAPTKGLYQAFTYHAGLSGGAWLLASIAGNDHPTISTLKTTLWQDALVNNSLYPVNTPTSKDYPIVDRDVASKARAGFIPTIADAWGRFLSIQMLKGPSGGVGTTMSSIAQTPSFLAVHAPYPIITALGEDEKDMGGPMCDPPDNGTQYEFTPYEFGSWDHGVNAFVKTEVLGSSLSNGASSSNGSCIRGYDDLGYIMGASSNKFQESCGETSIAVIAAMLQPIVNAAHNASRRDLYAPYTNPFRNYPGSPLVSSQPELLLVDGGEANQNNPIWPFLRPYRSVDVLLVNDNSADTEDNYPNGTEILHTYQQARLAGLTRMPFVPSVSTFMEKGLGKRATFFGCHDTKMLTIIYLPNTRYSFDSGQPSSRFEYVKADSEAMIKNGRDIATQNGDREWPVCLGCAIVMKTGEAMPTECKACFEKYCYVRGPNE